MKSPYVDYNMIEIKLNWNSWDILIVPLLSFLVSILSFWSPKKLVQQLNFKLQLQMLEQMHQTFSVITHPHKWKDICKHKMSDMNW